MRAAPDWTGVRQIIEAAEGRGAIVGVSILAPDGARFSHKGTQRFVAASTVKIPIMIALFRGIDAGGQSLDASHTLREADKAPGSGVLANLHAGLAPTVGDLAYLMISISDNTATNILIDRLTIGSINATMRDLGMRQSTLGRRMQGRHVIAGEEENWAAPDEYADVVAALWHGRAASAVSCQAMLALLETQQNTRRIARHLPESNRPRWGSKTGSLPGVANDVGFVVAAAGPLVLAVFCAELSDPHEGEQIIGAIAKAALGQVAP